MQPGTTWGAAPGMCPDKPGQFSPDGERWETMGIHQPWHSHACCKRFHKCYVFLKREKRAVGLRTLTCSVHPVK